MRIKKEQIILALIIIALLLYLVFRKQDQINYRIPDLPQIPRAEISSIEITGPGDSIILKKEDKNWVISPQGYLVNSSDINNILDFIEKPVLTVMVSDSKNYTRYGLDKDTRIIVRAFADKDLKREIEIGNLTDSRRHTFVKLAKDHRVYHAQDNQRDNFDKDMDEFRDKNVLSFDQKGIREIYLEKGTQFLTLTAVQVLPEETGEEEEDKDSQEMEEAKVEWQTSEGENVDESEVEDLLSTLSGLTCNAFLYEIQKEDLTDPLCSITMKGTNEYNLSIFPKKDDDEGYPAVSSGNESPFMLTNWKAEKIIEIPDKILKEPEEPGEAVSD